VTPTSWVGSDLVAQDHDTIHSTLQGTSCQQWEAAARQPMRCGSLSPLVCLRARCRLQKGQRALDSDRQHSAGAQGARVIAKCARIVFSMRTEPYRIPRTCMLRILFLSSCSISISRHDGPCTKVKLVKPTAVRICVVWSRRSFRCGRLFTKTGKRSDRSFGTCLSDAMPF
jgi:hypothetical protein